MIKVRHFAAETGTELAYEITEWLEHPSHDFVAIAYSGGLMETMGVEPRDTMVKERALLIYLEHEVPVV